MHNYFSQLVHSASQANHRFGVVLNGDLSWQDNALSIIKDLYANSSIFQLGGESCDDNIYSVPYKHGQRLLGQECSLLICDFSSGFDANSFSAALGCVKGGGIVVILPSTSNPLSLSMQWLSAALRRLINIDQTRPLPPLPLVDSFDAEPFSQQKLAVEKIRKVVEGHRKRPLVMTADRGRGKSSALGIAAAELMQSRDIRILVTAPSLATVAPVFEHARRLLPDALHKKGLVRFNAASLEFIAPDELLRQGTECDFLLVDEASAIPIPMLQKMVERHHRCVFSTTVHGYEGCGRGFTLKFQHWLKQKRAGSVFYHLEQPIRWNANDPLESWLFDTFLLNTEIAPANVASTARITLRKLDKKQLLNNSDLLRTCFALLVNAHYQTSPNDLMLLLEDDSIALFAAFSHQDCLGCILTITEGGLEQSLIDSIQQGVRRPKGHLVPVMLAAQLGLSDAARQMSLRIMRIATHPNYQSQGIGSAMLEQLSLHCDKAFISTSFGATKELLHFWRKNGFSPVRLGVQRDQASGCHSVLMIKGSPDWMESAERHFELSMPYLLGNVFNDIETDIVRNLLRKEDASVEICEFFTLIRRYCEGGVGYESVASFIASWLLSSPAALQNSSDLMIRKLIQQRSWQMCCEEFELSGRKQTELQLRADIQSLLDSTLV
ncbi:MULTISPECIES: tRNA(Met) cytidine acetyltransferase TmcA [Vibrio]|uniref:tRNA(Met) cytidine acetyltransferase TmcA n=1 Tax=Vibrio TaxID=662 RepID=UPI00207605B4|nr:MULTISPECIES: GNAT family N-acetyltransferase [Vibrio]USD34743.1 tRNA(Met) cytidine acetyltransferase [Vibrio sp. SCSIO 43186]USD47809.1 tRNA(Met) cytidine acetyltransferase [Vibrio sp. SCSIO 43145]USD71868.1 tRNA(Met) cytidine acetyltransferase [Vibrio sp. SCSIO 43139]USD98772.1 tRNA cytosine(34) acetyltransferase TmcA [Vibrio coralliilyticus]